MSLPGPGFLPTRQLVLVDLLALMLAARPGERAVIAVDGPDGVGRAQLVSELQALAPHVAGRTVLVASSAGLAADQLRHTVILPFLEAQPELPDDAVLLVEGNFLRRPELAADWAGTCLVIAPGKAVVDERQQRYHQQARLHPPTWIVDSSDPQRPELIEPDPEEPQWFEPG